MTTNLSKTRSTTSSAISLPRQRAVPLPAPSKEYKALIARARDLKKELGEDLQTRVEALEKAGKK